MFHDVDASLKQLLVSGIPIERNEVEVSFDRPNREWSGRLSRPALNLFLYDIRERQGFRDDVPEVHRTATGSRYERAPRRIDLSYMVTAWAREPEDEHRILGAALPLLYRSAEVPAEHLQGALRDSELPLLTRLLPSEHLAKPADLWGVLDNDLHASLTWVVTAPVDVFAPIAGPIVRTVDLGFAVPGESGREAFVEIGGHAYARGAPGQPVEGVTVALAGTRLRSVTGADGRFVFRGVPRGQHRLVAVSPDGVEHEHPVMVPSSSYDFEL